MEFRAGFGEVVGNASHILTNNTEGGDNVVNTSNEAELHNCIENAQNCMMNMGKVIDRLPVNAGERQELLKLCQKTGILLEEAKQRCEQIL